ncbi:MAG: hypothetical protein ACR2GD_02730, partial [Pyrinomonadaceae bacterium]
MTVKRNENLARLPSSARAPQNYLFTLAALITLLSLAVGAGFAFASPYLDVSQRRTLITFLFLFSFFGLGVSNWLILRHSRKLSVAAKDDFIEWRAMSPEVQRRKLNAEVSEIAAILNTPANQLSDLRSAYIVAQDLALRKVEQESNIRLMRHVEIEAAEFDAVFINRDVITFVETAFLVVPDIPPKKIDVILKKLDYVKKLFAKIRPDSKLKLMLPLITQLDRADEIKLRAALKNKFTGT